MMKHRTLTNVGSQRIVRIIIVGVIILLSWYVISRFMRIITGPSLVTFVATSDSEEYPGFIHIQGVTKNTETLLINDYPIVPAVDGGFEYTYVAQPGYSTVTLQAFDKFNNETTETISLYTDEPPDQTRITSTSQSIEDTDVESEESQETRVTNS